MYSSQQLRIIIKGIQESNLIENINKSNTITNIEWNYKIKKPLIE